MAADVPRLRVRDLTKVYRGPRGWGLSAVSFDVAAGSIVALGGPNGSGKSTLLRCIAGLMRHDGAVEIDGVPVDGSPAGRAAIGYLPQVVGLPGAAVVGEVLDLFAELRGVGRSTVPLPDGFVPPDDRPVAELSGGQAHRVALAVTLLGSPRILLLDEPVASLDEEGRSVFWSVLRARCRDGASALVSSPSPTDLRGLADRALSMREGVLVADEDLRVPRAELGDLLEAIG
jgi:ABC-2 type transport system ATP-binding protein